MLADVRFGSQADICSAPAHVRFVPIADIGSVWRNRHTERLSRFQVDDQIELGGLFHRQIARNGALQHSIYNSSFGFMDPPSSC
jgi:hypothetical protein